MPAPFKWTPDRFLAPVTNGGEPEVLGLDNGRLAIAVTQGAGPERFISFHFNSSYVASLNTAMQIASDPDVVYGAPGVAQTSGGEIVVAYGAELTIGGGSLEDVRYLKMHKPGDDAPGFRFANVGVGDGPDQQLHQAVAAGLHDQYAIAWADYVGADTAYMRIYSWRDGALATVAVNTTPGLYAQNVGTTSYRPLAIEGLSNGDYVVAWTGLDFTSRIRVMSASGTPQTPEIPLAGGSTSIWPDITELADGRFVATSFVGGAIHFGIFNADGTTSVADTTFATTVSGSFGQRVSTAALPDGRFVVVWVNAALETRGQMFLPDGTADGAEFAIADVTTGVQTRPSVDALADGRFAVAWETNESGSPQVKYTIFDPRAGNQILTGTADDDVFEGTSFDDAMYGGLGEDHLRGGAGADYLRGGDDRDTLNGGDNGDLLFGEQQADTLFGENGDDFLYGGLGSDTLSGGAGNDVLYGEENDDVLLGDADNDVLIGGAGDDVLYGVDGADSADGGLGDDTFYGGIGADYALGGDGNDTLIGEAGNDQLYGGAGVDSIDGGADADTIYGGADGDFIQGGAGGDVLIGEAGNDDINGGTEDDSIDGGDGGDTLRGGDGSDFIQGGAGADSLFGDAGADTLNGGADGDTLTGGTGGDTMTGGTGFDVFFFAVGSGVDVITDFEDNIDKINLSTYAGATFANTIIAQSGANTVVSFAGAFADQAILVNFTATNLTVSDFLF